MNRKSVRAIFLVRLHADTARFHADFVRLRLGDVAPRSASEKGKLMAALYTHLSRKIHSPSGNAVQLDALGADTNFRCLVQNMAEILGVPFV